MALYSQVRRGNTGPRSSETYKRARRGEQKRLVGYLLLALLVVGGVMYSVQSRPRSAAAEPVGDPGAARTAAAKLKDAGESVQPVSSAPIHPPVVMEMGSRRSGGGSMGGGEMLLASGGGRQAFPHADQPAPTPPSAPIQPRRSGGDSAAAETLAPPSSASTQPAAPVRDPLISAPGEGLGSTPPPMPEPGEAPGSATVGVPADLAGVMVEADRSITAQRPAQARALLNRVVIDARTPEAARAAARAKMEELNQTLVFSPAVLAGDSLSAAYSVASKDSLVRIARSQSLATEPGLIARVNNLSNPNALNVGQKLKLVRGPFHAVVHKGSFRMDVFAGPTPSMGSAGSTGTALAEGVEAGWIYIRSFTVGLGEKGATPLGNFVVKDNSKLVNPYWTNPRTGEKFDADDPKNPIGERWIGLEGLDVKSKGYTGYGVHGTIDPSSIGREMSMGCVRMRAEDVEIVYDLLMPRVSVVRIVP